MNNICPQKERYRRQTLFVERAFKVEAKLKVHESCIFKVSVFGIILSSRTKFLGSNKFIVSATHVYLKSSATQNTSINWIQINIRI